MPASRSAPSGRVFLFLLLASSPGSLTGQLVQNGPPQAASRQGMWLNAGVGAGIGNDIGGQSANLAVGWTLSPRFLLALGTSDWRTTVDRDRVTFGTLDLRTQFYPEANRGFFLTGGLGLGYFQFSPGGTGPDLGRAILIGLGYDARIADNMSITTFINVAGIHTPDPRTQVGQIGVGLTFH
jgi:hypothetical protein